MASHAGTNIGKIDIKRKLLFFEEIQRMSTWRPPGPAGKHSWHFQPVDMIVQVDSAGKATSVSVLDSPSQQLTQFVAQVAMLTKFKPATCAGAPCAMQFPVRINLTRRW